MDKTADAAFKTRRTEHMVMIRRILAVAALALAFVGCTTIPPEAIRVGTYNIRLEPGDKGTPNAWQERKDDLVALVKKLDLDVFGMQEVCPPQAQYFREQLADWEFVGDHRGADRVTDEASPVFFRKSRFEALQKGTFWLSETPEVPASKSWGTCCTRVCSYLILRDRRTGKRFCFANTHTDHVSAEAREKGMLLVVKRMKEFGAGSPIIFTGDHNCCYDDAPAKAVRKIMKDGRDVTETPAKGPRNTFQGFGKYKDGPVNWGGAIKDYCIDYIYVSEGTRVLDFVTHDDKRPGTDLYPSDHYPVTATVVLP